MRIRIPYAPGRALSIGGQPHPAAVKVKITRLGHPQHTRPHRLLRVASAPGWMLLLVRYDQEAAE